MNNYLTMRQLGTLFGVTSHVIGKLLKKLGLRDENGKPTTAAFQGNLVKTAPIGTDGRYFWVWEADTTIAVLEANGLKRVSAEVDPIA